MYGVCSRGIDIFRANVFDSTEVTPSSLMNYKMRVKQVVLAVAAAATSLVSAQQTAWGQCGGQGIVYSSLSTVTTSTDNGIGWSGPTSCVSGYVCTYLNNWHSAFPQSQSHRLLS